MGAELKNSLTLACSNGSSNFSADFVNKRYKKIFTSGCWDKLKIMDI